MPINAAGLPLPCPARKYLTFQLRAPWERRSRSLVTTSDRDAITLFAGVTINAWTDLRIPHAPIAVGRGGLEHVELVAARRSRDLAKANLRSRRRRRGKAVGRGIK